MRGTVDTEFELFLADLWGGLAELAYGPGPSAESAMVQAAIRRGVTNENELTNLVFFRRYPARNGRLLSRDEPNFGPLSQEWLSIRDTLVRPLLGDLGPARLRCTRLAGDRDLAAVLAGQLRLAAPATSPAVKRIQEVLISAGYLPRQGADGRFGPGTAAAVSRFKADRRIEPPDPVVGPETIRALDAVCLLLEGDQGQMIDVSRATRYIAVASPSRTTTDEWRVVDPRRSPPTPYPRTTR